MTIVTNTLPDGSERPIASGTMVGQAKYLHAVVLAAHGHLKRHGVACAYRDDVLRASIGPRTASIGDVAWMVEDFDQLDVHPDLVGQALAAMALDELGIEHDLHGHGLTIAVRGVRP